ncbi:ABC transporter ATP-binding protein [Dehalogenimonas etheniformans]|uniref:ABC transporter ATP-binding protein n=1 Tax=Dehalogenimonas etheniformans TaxID=1536648 RepID=A0A2P5P586_9CHLR|nr:ABC transporter ATP-binding protein [Dehalogenimonas etheniformans]PPD57458.1 ABC transporter ATP-binding protein [Dehalogenimonas etheniformans]QNT76821.1 ABC transporter ATP-binding protein [Dehalogenimonas etheniformans]
MAPAIKTEGLTKRFGDVVAVDKLDLSIDERAVFGFLGPNGAGKTTTVKMLTGLSAPTEGKAYICGQEVTQGSVEVRKNFGFLPDVPAFYDWMTGEEYLRFAGELYGMTYPGINKRAAELLELVELKKASKRKVGGYSRGMKQRLGIAQAMLNHPRVLFLDEPTSALDPIGRRDVLDLIGRLKEEATVFMSTHILSDVERVCDGVAIIDKGKLLVTSTVEELRHKYSRSTFEIEFDEDGQAFADSLQSKPWFVKSEKENVNGNPTLRITARDIGLARKELPHLIAGSGLTLVRYELVQPSLEDIFVEVVNGK